MSLALGATTTRAQNKDLPGPTQNIKAIAIGSYIIPMDNTYQLNGSSLFNMKAYGLVVHLLNNQVPIKWCIRTGKLKDDTDLQTTSEQIKPTFIASVATNFRGGPFIIEAVDTAGVAALVDAYYASKSLTGANRPKVYRLTKAEPVVDIRYDLTNYIVRTAILTDGGNQAIHVGYMTDAGVPSGNYRTSNGTDLVGSCYTFASEPHNGNSGATVNAAITGIKSFVTAGGNFLAQCEGVENYENNVLGRFQTTGGINVLNQSVNTSVTFANPDLSYSQFVGPFDANYGGSIKNWTVIGSYINNAHDHILGTGALTTAKGASVAKFGTGLGGLVFYLGSHDFNPSSQEGTNGLRMFMNAMLTPARYNCPVTVLPLRLTRFGGRVVEGRHQLSWTIATNEQVSRFVVERSFDGQNFSFVAGVPANFTNNEESYYYTGPSFNTTTYYRINITDREGKTYFSQVISVGERIHAAAGVLRVANNPHTSGDLICTYTAERDEQVHLQVLTEAGHVVYRTNAHFTKGVNQVSVPQQAMHARGTYMIQVINQKLQKATAKALKR